MQAPVRLLGGLASTVVRLYSGTLDLEPSETSYASEITVSCLPFSPKLFKGTPPLYDDPFIYAAAQQVHEYLSERSGVCDISSLSVAVQL